MEHSLLHSGYGWQKKPHNNLHTEKTNKQTNSWVTITRKTDTVIDVTTLIKRKKRGSHSFMEGQIPPSYKDNCKQIRVVWHCTSSFQSHIRQVCCCVLTWNALICYDTVWVEAWHERLVIDVNWKMPFSIHLFFLSSNKACHLHDSMWHRGTTLFFGKWSFHIQQAAYQCWSTKLR